MSDRTILVAHRHEAVRQRFTAALDEARHGCVTAGDARGARRAVADASPAVSLALVDLGLADDGVALVRALRAAAGRVLPVVVFSGSVARARDVAALAALGVSGYVNEHAAPPQILPSLAPHLFPDNFNRRTSPRVTLGVPVSFRSGQVTSGAVTLDVGKGGLAIRTMSPLPRGSAVHLRFRLPGVTEDLEAAARVAWSDRKVGMGLQFEHLTAADQATVDAFIDDHVQV